jgi:hypothetical protein
MNPDTVIRLAAAALFLVLLRILVTRRKKVAGRKSY